jgi:hypothetical protein
MCKYGKYHFAYSGRNEINDCLMYVWIAREFISSIVNTYYEVVETYDVCCSFIDELGDRCVIEVS